MADSKISALPAGSDPDGTEPIPGVQGGATVKLTTDQLVKGNWRLGTPTTASGAAAYTVTNISAAARRFRVEFYDVRPSTDAVNFILQTSTDNGVSYDSGGSDYVGLSTYMSNGVAGGANQGGSSIMLNVASVTLGNGTDYLTFGWVELYHPGAAQRCQVKWEVNYFSVAAASFVLSGAFGYRDAAADVNAIRLMMDSGNINGVFVPRTFVG